MSIGIDEVKKMDSFLNEIEASLIDAKATKLKELRKSISGKPSDVVVIDESAHRKLCDMWNPTREARNVPSDLIFANTIPIYDLEIVYKFDDFDISDTVSIRVSVDREAVDSLEHAAYGTEVMVGVVAIYAYAVPMCVIAGEDFMFCNMEYTQILGEKFGNVEYAGKALSFLMTTWYGIQIALLHPEIKEVFRKPRTIPYKPDKSPGKHGKRRKPLRYVKQHVISGGDIDNVLCKRTINRKALAWRVVGHWRHYSKSDKKVFVKGFWKGALRNVKASEETREREIAQIAR